MGDKRFVVMTPMWRDMSGATAFALERANKAGVPFVWVPQPGDALIGRARSIQCTQFLENIDTDYMVFLDSDIVFEPKDLMKLHSDMKDGGYELIGGVYTVRGAGQLAHYGVNGGIRLDGNITEVAYLSTGFMGIAKSLLKKMVLDLALPICHPKTEHFRCYPFFENRAVYSEYAHEWIYISEDWDFCDKARKVGVKPYLDTSVRLGHKGEKEWRVEDLAPQAVKPLPPKIWTPEHGKTGTHPGLVLPVKGRK